MDHPNNIPTAPELFADTRELMRYQPAKDTETGPLSFEDYVILTTSDSTLRIALAVGRVPRQRRELVQAFNPDSLDNELNELVEAQKQAAEPENYYYEKIPPSDTELLESDREQRLGGFLTGLVERYQRRRNSKYMDEETKKLQKRVNHHSRQYRTGVAIAGVFVAAAVYFGGTTFGEYIVNQPQSTEQTDNPDVYAGSENPEPDNPLPLELVVGGIGVAMGASFVSLSNTNMSKVSHARKRVNRMHNRSKSTLNEGNS